MTNIKKNKRYETVKYKDIKGIRKDLKSGKFYVEKYIRGKRYSQTFSRLADAADWKKNFHPSLSLKSVSKPKRKRTLDKVPHCFEAHISSREIKKINGNNLGYTFFDVWSLFFEKHVQTLEESTKERWLKDVAYFSRLMDLEMIHFDADLISNHLFNLKELALKNPKSKRCNFDNHLKDFKTILNWYKENCDEYFVNPILKRHYKEGFIKKTPKRRKKMKEHELLSFFEALEKDSLFWRDFAETQFFFSSRVQEPAGLLVSSIDFISRTVMIENVLVWSRENKRFLYLKDSPKNEENCEITLNNRVLEILQRRVNDRPKREYKVCPKSGVKLNLVFHLDGEPLSYRQIQYHYDKALKVAGLSDKYGSTHIMRHSMANMVRDKLGLDSAQAVGRWKSRDLVENVYTEMPDHVGAEARMKIESLLYGNTDEMPPQDPNPRIQSGLKLVKS